MGEHHVDTTLNDEKRLEFIKHLLDDIEALEQMLSDGLIESGITRIGAEQEFCLVDENWRPANNSIEILNEVNDDHFTTELAKYNLEINLDPIELKADAFSKMESQLHALLKKARQAAHHYQSKIVLTGILPSISAKEIELNYMTEYDRYYALNDRLKSLRGSDFRLHLSGVDELSIRHDSVMFEACNTSFQMHLQIDPSDFISSYNWAQVISGPVLGLCVNSPLLLGKELWQETRIALFQQSIDTRSVSYALKDQNARVTFGDSWLTGNVTDIFKNDISNYKIILTKEIQENALEELKKGIAPKLKALNLHNGTIYRWNRACYGVGNGKAHLRIENRYIPSGPTEIDEMANFAFWVGLMLGRPKSYDNLPELMDFNDAKSNFVKAARYGSEAMFNWMGKSFSLSELTQEHLLPIARKGLGKAGILQKDIDRYLNIIEKRIQTHTSAQWIIKSYRSLKKEMRRDDALLVLTKMIHEKQKDNTPIHEWETQYKGNIHERATEVRHIMTTRLLTASDKYSAELTLKLMQWNNIRHLPVVNLNDTLVGLLTWTHISKFNQQKADNNHQLIVSEVMEKSVTTVSPSTSIQDAIALMKQYEFGCLPVTKKGQLVGIITIKDVLAFDHD